MSFANYIAQRRAAGIESAARIHAELVAPSKVVTTGKEARPTANLETELRNLIVPDLMTLTLWNNTAPEAREELVETRLVNRKAAAADAAAYVALDMLEARMNRLVRIITRRGGDPFGASSGVAERETTTTSDGPALWQTFGIDKPTVKQVRELMR